MAWEQLKHLPVTTKSGQGLGKVTGFIFDPETHNIIQYEVKQGTFGRLLLVGVQQVLGITAERMVVEDAVSSQVEPKPSAVPTPAPTISGLASTRFKE